MEQFDWKKHILECLESAEFCCLGTTDGDRVWTNPMHFSWDEKCRLYFISLPSSRHMQNISKNEKIAISIFNATQSPYGDVIGIQLEGRAVVLKTTKEIEEAYKHYHVRVPYLSRRSDTKVADDFIYNPTWHMVQVIPDHIYYFDTRYFNEETQGKQEVPKDLDLS